MRSASAPRAPPRGRRCSAWARISIESTPTTSPRSLTTGPYCASSASRSGERVAEDVVELEQRLGLERSSSVTRSPCSARSDEPAERAAALVDQERVGHLAVGGLGARLGDGSPTRTSGAFQRSTSRTRWSASRLSARSAPTKSSTNAVGRVHQQLRRRRVLGELAAALHDRDAVAHLDRLVDVVGDEHDRLADLALEPQELVLEPLAVDRVDRAERLVHQHQRRVNGQRPRHADALALAAGELGGVAVARLVRVEADQLEQLVDALADALLRPAQQPRHGGDVGGHRQVREQPDLLDRVADLAAQVGRLALASRCGRRAGCRRR